MQSESELDRASVTRLSIELAPLVAKRASGTLTDAEGARLEELVATLTAAGVVLDLTVKDASPSEPYVPPGSVLGSDGIIRSKPGVFEARYRREVFRRGQSESRYRSEAAAMLRLRRPTRVHVPGRAITDRRPAGRPRRVRRRAHAPPRERDEPELADHEAERR